MISMSCRDKGCAPMATNCSHHSLNIIRSCRKDLVHMVEHI
ncbi:hypothetical protein CIPAW_14G050300 [Carya illinoinensis]|uniref:Uncharacterized protein n=1 Tax=Carya illinoinensis TaxID=32201 RepID=A0A8T1NGM0_CARIL|nr:hypothetical protein CIPAW_14G050300 [Carya illinoinensis]